MWVKICGITNEDDALMSIALGADAVGFVFAPSPRQVTVGAVRDIVRRLPSGVMTVGVFRDHSPDQVVETVLSARLHAAQLHGHETPAEAQEIQKKVQALIVAAPAGSHAVDRFPEFGADALLLDAQTPGGGEIFDWSLAKGVAQQHRTILAGGLTPEIVAEGIATVRPWGVDVSTGVEFEPGNKDPRKVLAFIRHAKAAFVAVHRGETVVVPETQTSGPEVGWRSDDEDEIEDEIVEVESEVGGEEAAAKFFDWDDDAEPGRGPS